MSASNHRRAVSLLGLVGVLLAMPATAQDEPIAGRTASSSGGQVGQRQTRESIVPTALPMARIANRMTNRVSSRISNRIDRNYSAQGGTVSAIEQAQGKTLRAGASMPR